MCVSLTDGRTDGRTDTDGPTVRPTDCWWMNRCQVVGQIDRRTGRQAAISTLLHACCPLCCSYGLLAAISTLLQTEMQPCLSTIITEMLESVKSTEGITVCTAHTPPRRSPPIPHSRDRHPSIPHPAGHPQYHTQQGLSPLHTPPHRSPPIPHTAGAVTPPYPTPQVTPNTTHSRGRHPSIPHPTGHPQYHTQQELSPLHTPPRRSPPIPHAAGAVIPPYPTDHCSQCSDI